MPIVDSGMPIRGIYRRGVIDTGKQRVDVSDDDEEDYHNNDDDDDDDDDEDELSPASRPHEGIYGDSSPQSIGDTRKWDVFRNMPPETNSGSTANQKCLDITVKCLKIFAYFVTFGVVLVCGMITKGTVLFMTSQIKPRRKLKYCNKDPLLDRSKEYEVDIPDLERVAWIWCLFFAFVLPEFGTWFRSTRICVFKSWEKPRLFDFLITFAFETLHTAGLALLIFVVLPELDVVKAAMLTNWALSRHLGKDQKRGMGTITKISIDVLAIVAQATGFVVWPWVENNRTGADPAKVWIVPIAVMLTSFGWWENYVNKKSTFTSLVSLSSSTMESGCKTPFPGLYIGTLGGQGQHQSADTVLCICA
ncbi:unnamed protein product [Notodromas monacha]|uniref:Chitin synthase chs-1/2 N-terminal putative transporter domain-containing protein n=1 Tax=Notodromas monacha TaxID=399045 RepID=A0A7R9BSS1_9CRUS|nr:unnamed protein product [Notodromas monacha]CAG0919439.1 unnamed protein product [Notodromas monacha]